MFSETPVVPSRGMNPVDEVQLAKIGARPAPSGKNEISSSLGKTTQQSTHLSNALMCSAFACDSSSSHTSELTA